MSTLARGAVDRIPPSNLEAEMALLGSILVDREMMGAVGEIVSPVDFYAHVHETIFLALVQLYERGEPLDKITLAEELRARGLLDNVGGLAYLTSLMDTVPTAASAEYYAQIVREKAALRGLIHAGTQITQIGFESEEDVEAAIDRSEQVVYEVGRRRLHGDFAPIRKLLKGTFEQIDRLYHSRGDRTGLTSGFRDIDEYTSGFQPGNFVILAARPAMGKTSMALTMAAAAAKEEQKPIAIFSLEMTNEELVTRLLCGEARINSLNLRRGNIKDSEWEKISSGMSALSEMPIYIDDSGTVTVSEIRSRCRRLKSGEGLAAVFIDYLQLVRPSSTMRMQNRNDELSEICRMLKATAKDLEIPIIALAQLNRGVESRNDKRPMLSDLRDCLAGGALVTDADSGRRVPIAEIVRDEQRFNVWALDDSLKLVRRPIVDAWAAGEKALFRVTTRSGRTIRCTGGHRFRTVAGWKTLDDLNCGSVIAVPRTYGTPNPPQNKTSEGRALLLGWILGDGHLGGSVARASASALLRLGINSIVTFDSRNVGGYRTTTKRMWTLSLLQRGAVRAFMDIVGFVGEKHERAVSKLVRLKENDAGRFDRIPLEVNGRVRDLKVVRRLSHQALGWREQGKAMSRSTRAALAERLNDSDLEVLAFSDVLWDPIASIEPDGHEMTYDLSVEDLHNYCVDDFITHNSGAIEQEADMVTFLYRDAYYNPESAVEPDLTEFIIAKSRNGPTGTVKLRFLKEHTLFVPYGDSGHYSGP
jgi:replicative DNA helicase